MSRKIAKILGEPEHLVMKALKELEEKNGFPSHDARFLAENIQKTRVKLADLELDPDDTTGPELYHALQSKFAKNSRLFELHYAAEDMTFDQKIAKAIDLVTNNFEIPNYWVLKSAAVKKILRELPPKHTLKYLKYRSLESMLKREKISEIFLVAKYLESDTWQKTQHRLISKLGQTDFELRPMSFINLKYQKWAELNGPEDYLARNYEAGIIAFWPSSEVKEASLLNLTLLLSDGLAIKKQAKLSGVLDWWTDLEHSVAELDGEHVSLNLRDNALSSLVDHSYESRQMKHAQHNFWQELVSRYENVPPSEALFDGSVKDRIQQIKFKAPEPSLEFAEEFDG